MARTDITNSVVALSPGEYDITASADYTTIAIGAGNGVEFTYNPADTIIVKGGAGATVFTVKMNQDALLAAYPVVVPDLTITLATADVSIIHINTAARQDTSSLVRIDCDVADGEILIVRKG